jgi:ABC-2 type transport system ATP-binding protein
MLADPPILILDEPTAGLDPLQSRETRNTIKELGDKHTILFSTHILSEVEEVCQRVIIIRSGHIGVDKKMAELTTDRASLVVEVRGPTDEVRKAIQAVEGVEHVDVQRGGDGVTTCEVRCKEDRDLREVIGERLFKNGWTLRRLDQRQRRLAELFASVAVFNPAEMAPPSTALPGPDGKPK